MKTKLHFFYTFEKRVVSRTYGGENFSLGIYQNKGVGKIVRIGDFEGCTRAHKGFESDAWGVIWKTLSRRVQARLLALCDDYDKGRIASYLPHSLIESGAVKLEQF